MVGRPDGATVDADGCYWYAGVGGWELVRVTPAGVLDRIVSVPVEKPTKPVFGGRKLDTLYVSSIGIRLAPGTAGRQPQAGGVFALNVGVRGMPPNLFAG